MGALPLVRFPPRHCHGCASPCPIPFSSLSCVLSVMTSGSPRKLNQFTRKSRTAELVETA
jgi:hypothetical protein